MVTCRLNIADEQLRERLLFAVPKKGRLYEPSTVLLDKCGIKVEYIYKKDMEIVMHNTI